MATNSYGNLAIDNCRSYATETELKNGLRRFGFADERHLVVCNSKGRFTAIFPLSNIMGASVAKNDPRRAGDLTRYSRRGFMTLG